MEVSGAGQNASLPSYLLCPSTALGCERLQHPQLPLSSAETELTSWPQCPPHHPTPAPRAQDWVSLHQSPTLHGADLNSLTIGAYSEDHSGDVCKQLLLLAFSLLSKLRENVTQGHYYSMSRHGCWMPALCPATEGCQACKRSRKPVAGYCLRKLN